MEYKNVVAELVWEWIDDEAKEFFDQIALANVRDLYQIETITVPPLSGLKQRYFLVKLNLVVKEIKQIMLVF